MAVKLHRCGATFAKLSGHPCWRVEKALIDMGVPYERVTGPARKSKRDDLERLSGQRQYPVIELEDGTAWREESAVMAEAIRAGRLSAESPDAR
jgi:glutathione S-transferase